MSDFSQQFPVVFGALNEGFLQTLKLFAITLAGALPLGLVIYFGEVNSWAPFAALASRLSAAQKSAAQARDEPQKARLVHRSHPRRPCGA